jgi:predicted AlkP superfamily phosphohydrolase/phosphomutase/Flp pilus assembly protein TadD
MRRPFRPRVFAALALFLFAAACRRAVESRAAPAPTPVPRAAAVEASDVAARERRPPSERAPVIWLGLDGLDWELLDRLAAEGKMPNWKRLTAEGATGSLSSFVPILSPVIWTTAATGVGPDVHRVLDFQEVDPKTGQKVPISGRSRAVPAVWNLASGAGRRVGVVGWWATHPAEEVTGFFVSDRASPILFSNLPLAGVAYPSNLEPGVAQVVARDGAVTAADLLPYLDVPASDVERALASGAGMEDPVVALGRILAATRVYQRIARDLYDRQHPDLMALYLEGTDEVGHVFASFVPPKLECVGAEDVRRYGRAVDVFYGAIDRILGQWMRRAEEDGATLFVHSDHGFKWGADRPCERSSLNWATAGYWHRPEGVYAFWGARVRRASARGRAAMKDVAPTVLALLGLPADRRMEGRPIAGAIENLAAPAREDFFGKVAVRRVAAEEMNAQQASEYAKKLLALGYLSGSETRPLAPTGGKEPGMTEGAWNNLGLYERGERRYGAARRDFEKSLALRPDYHSPMFNLAVLYRDQNDFGKAEDWLFKSLAAGHADPEGTLANWAFVYRTDRHEAAERHLLDRAARTYPASERLARELALARFRGKDCSGADQALGAVAAATRDPETLNALALVRTCLGRREEAIALFERSLALKPQQPGVVQSLRLLRGEKGPPSS